MLKFKSLAAKFIFIGGIISAFFAIFIYTSLVFTHNLRGNASRIALAGKERMLIIGISYQVKFMLLLPPSTEKEIFTGNAESRIAEYEKALYILRDGSEKLMIKPISAADQESISHLNTLIELWQKKQKPALLVMLKLPPERKNEACGMCHSAIRNNIPMIETLVKSLETQQEKVLRDRDTLKYYVIGFFFILAGFITFFVRRTIIKPVGRLSDATKEIEQGNFDARVNVKTNNDIGVLGNMFNNMAQNLKQLFNDKIQHLQELIVLNEVSTAAGQSLRREVMLDKVLNAILSLEPLSLEKKGAVFLYDEDEKILKLIVSSNFSNEFAGRCSTVPYGECLCGLCVEKDEIIVSGNSEEDKRHSRTEPEAKGHGHVILPLKARDKILGVICLYLPAGIKLSDREIELCRSITDIISVSLQNVLSYEKTQQSEASLREAQRIARLGNWRWDVVKNTLYWSDELYRIFGLSPQEFVVSYETFLNCVHPDDREFVSKSVNDALYEGKPFSIDHRIVLPDGAEHIIHAQADVIFDESGKPIKMLGTVQDVTERKQLEYALQKFNEELTKKVQERTKELMEAKEIAEAANRAKSEFLANMSHELRTPLNSVIGFSEVLTEGLAGNITDKQKEYVQDIWKSGKHLLRLINDILDLSNIETGTMELELSEFDIKELIAGSLVIFKEKAIKHKIKFTSNIPDDIGVVTADAVKIKQALLNLLGNAFKFTDDGGSVRVTARKVRRSEIGVRSEKK
ncbi:MAG: PAS domain-containing protein [Nitrospirae bacterium]|nr:PAS domain-containing protein [Nitrospirota bacterium]